jgi:molybdate transport system regulatory protein
MDQASGKVSMSGSRTPLESPALWFRILLPSGSLGPGKVALLRLVAETGSVSAAAKKLGMSHARSVKLVAELNALGDTPVLETRSGGLAGGGTALTEAGRRLLRRFDALNEAVGRAAKPHLELLAKASDEW